MKQTNRLDWKVYHQGSDHQFEHPEILLGAPSSFSLVRDPKHLSFVLSRYKFVAKMLDGCGAVMEVGSGDGIGLPLVAQTVKHVHCVDWDERHIESIKRRLTPHVKTISLHLHDFNEDEIDLSVQAMYWVDVIEHLDPENETVFMNRIVQTLANNGMMITGTPNISAAHLQSEESKVQHINLKSFQSLKELMGQYFENIFMFGMNDEMLHTGYSPMCHYIWSIACGLRDPYRK